MMDKIWGKVSKNFIFARVIIFMGQISNLHVKNKINNYVASQ